MSTFHSLSSLRSLVAGRHSDLATLRKLSNETTAKVKKLEDARFTRDYVTAEQAKVREAATQNATRFLQDAQTFTHCDTIAAQSEYWSVGQFLARSAGAPSDQLGLLKQLCLLTALPRMTCDIIAQTAEAAAFENNWHAVGAAYNELNFRALANDGPAQVAKLQLEQTMTLPPLVEAENLIMEGAQLREFISYTMRSIASGDPDLGLRMEAIARAGDEPDTVKAKALIQEELDREGKVVTFKRSA